MPSSDPALACRVCGLVQDEPPWGEDGKTPSFDFCACCGTEFGYQDANVAAARAARQRWLDGGAKWDAPKAKPAEWSAQAQLENVPPDFR